MAEYAKEERRLLLSLARETIRRRLAGEPPPVPAANPRLEARRGVFVTLHLHGQLRGCIGYPLPEKPLAQAVVENAQSAAFGDPRFPPLTKKEFPAIDIEISVLTEPRPVSSPEEVQIGRDGIIIQKGFHRGLFLPQVPVEQGWDLEQYLSYGCRKAGLPADEWRRGVQIEVFSAEVFGETEDEVQP